jgi:hypothetical protein
MNLLDHVVTARQKFLFYHKRGLEENKWHRENSMYIYWAFLDDDDKDFTPAFEVFERVCKIFESNYEYDRIIFQFDLMEKYAKNWIFS